MKLIFILLLFLSGCSLLPSHADNELELMTEQVLKKKEGIEIQLIPLPELPFKK